MEGVVSTSGQHGAENGTGDDPQKVDAGAEDAGSIREKQSRHRDESPRRRDGSPKRKADSPRRSDDQKKDTSRNGDDRSHRRDHRSDRDSHRDSHRDRDDRHRKREDVRDRDRDRGRREDADRRRPEDDRRRERDDNRRRDRQDDRRGDDRRGGGDDRRSDRGRPRRDDNRDHDWRRDERPPGDRREPERRAGVEEEEEGAVAMPAYVEPTVPEASGPAREPQSLELMMALQVKAAQAESKPVFLSKAQRAELALEKRRAEVAEQRAQERLEREAREKEEREARERPREREWDRERREAERKEREKRNQEEKEKRSGARLNDNELIQIKRDYLGFKPPKKTFVKNSDKFRFNFDWGKDEDTSVDNNPLYAKRFDYKPQFGRGYIGGIDQKAQIREYMKGLDKKQGPGSKNIEAVNFERTELDAKSSRLDKLDRHEIHWSEKSLDKMSERDWRIFREDHNMQVSVYPVRPGLICLVAVFTQSLLPSALFSQAFYL